jgi:ADP-heptose:LPS heptosyltransferase
MREAAAIVTDKQLGDVLLQQPCAEMLAHKTGMPTCLWVRKGFRPLVELMPGCAWPSEGIHSFSEVWCTSWGSKAALQAWKLKTRNRRLVVNKLAHVHWWHRLVFHQILIEKIITEYWGHYFWRVCGGSPNRMFHSPQLSSPPDNWRHKEEPSGEFVVINPTAAWPQKYWNAIQWRDLITRVKSFAPSLTIVIAGGSSASERTHCEEIVANCGIDLLNLAGKTSLMEYLHLLSNAQLVVCIDGAASHISQAFDVKSVTIFGTTHDLRWHWPTKSHIALAARHFMPDQKFGPAAGVPVEAVWETVSSLLKID